MKGEKNKRSTTKCLGRKGYGDERESLFERL